jgi:hypothetical protein
VISTEAERDSVRLLEARFHPDGRANEFVSVGWIASQSSRLALGIAPDLEDRLKPHGWRDVVAGLRHIVSLCQPRTADALLSLENAHWSFVLAAAQHPG